MAKRSKKKAAPLSALGERLTVLETPRAVRSMIVGLSVFCALLFLADLAHIRHGKFAAEDLLGFYGFYGFLAFSFIIISTKYLRMAIGRSEDYYAPDAVDAEDYPPKELAVKEHGDA